MMQTSSWPFNCSKKEYCVSRMDKSTFFEISAGAVFAYEYDSKIKSLIFLLSIIRGLRHISIFPRVY